MRGLPEYCIYTHYSIYIDLVARPWLFSRLLFCRIPAVSRNVRVGLLTEVGLAPQARPREQPGRLRRVAQVSLRRLAPDLQACLLFPHRTQTHCRESPRCFPRIVHVLSKCYFLDLRISDAGAFLVRRDPSLRVCCALFALRAHEKGRGVGWGSRSDFVKMN